MAPLPASYLLGGTRDPRSIQAAVSARFSTARSKRPRIRAVCHDTFDWRLHHSGGGAILVEAGLGDKSVRWTTARGRVRYRANLPEAPKFAWDLPQGDFREKLTSVIEMRRLLPIAALEVDAHEVRILDEARKTVARVRLETRSVAPLGKGGRRQRLPAILRAVPVRGYDDDYAELIAFLEQDLELEPHDGDELLAAYEAVGSAPMKYSSKPVAQLDPEQRADDAMKGILLALLDTMLLNESGTREDLDSEFLHDFRVSVRRTRSALSQIKGVFPEPVVLRFKREFSWLGGLTGPTRDLDVYLLKMPAYKATLPESVRNDLVPLRHFLENHQRIEQRKVARSLGTKRYRTLVESWRAFLESPSPEASDLPWATRPIHEVAQRRIWKAYRRVVKKGRAITPATEAGALHRLRIDCKKLRYLMEFFRSLFDAKSMGIIIKALKQLQDNLGDFNDYEVQQGALVKFAHQMVEEDIATVEGLMAMGRLVEHLEEGQAQERQLFHEKFRAFEAPANRERFRSLFKPSKGRP